MLEDQSGSRQSGRLIKALALALVIAMAVSVAYGALVHNRSFSSFGAVKQVALPAIFAVFLLAAVVRGRDERGSRIEMPRIWSSLMWLVVLSTGLALVFPNDSSTVDAAMQGLVLFGGIGVSAWLGFSAKEWPARRQHQLTGVLIAGGLVSAALQVGIGPFVSLAAPGMLAAVLLALRAERHAGWMWVLTLVFGAFFVSYIRGASAVNPLSIALLLQILVCALVLGLIVLTRWIRALAVVSLVGGGGAVLWSNASEFGYLVGAHPAYQDVTLAQRGYETFKAFETVSASLITQLFGAGPGGVVNLVSSPDAVTLHRSGRDLTQVDDVHLLSSYLLLKLGLVGLVWLTALGWHVCRLSRRILLAPRPDTFDTVLLMFALAGIAVGVPAATNFMANPLPVLLLAILARRYPEPNQATSGHRGASVPRLGGPGTASREVLKVQAADGVRRSRAANRRITAHETCSPAVAGKQRTR